VSLSWERGRVFVREVATYFEGLVKAAKQATVVSVEQSRHKVSGRRPPAAYGRRVCSQETAPRDS